MFLSLEMLKLLHTLSVGHLRFLSSACSGPIKVMGSSRINHIDHINPSDNDTAISPSTGPADRKVKCSTLFKIKTGGDIHNPH